MSPVLTDDSEGEAQPWARTQQGSAPGRRQQWGGAGGGQAMPRSTGWPSGSGGGGSEGAVETFDFEAARASLPGLDMGMQGETPEAASLLHHGHISVRSVSANAPV